MQTKKFLWALLFLIPFASGVTDFVNDVWPIFLQQASGHIGTASSGGFTMGSDPQFAYSSIVGAPCNEYPPLYRVAPGNSSNSYLYIKLAGMPPVGSQMPDGGPYFSLSTLGIIQSWIDEGAIFNKSQSSTTTGKQNFSTTEASVPTTSIQSTTAALETTAPITEGHIATNPSITSTGDSTIEARSTTGLSSTTSAPYLTEEGITTSRTISVTLIQVASANKQQASRFFILTATIMYLWAAM